MSFWPGLVKTALTTRRASSSSNLTATNLPSRTMVKESPSLMNALTDSSRFPSPPDAATSSDTAVFAIVRLMAERRPLTVSATCPSCVFSDLFSRSKAAMRSSARVAFPRWRVTSRSAIGWVSSSSRGALGSGRVGALDRKALAAPAIPVTGADPAAAAAAVAADCAALSWALRVLAAWALALLAVLACWLPFFLCCLPMSKVYSMLVHRTKPNDTGTLWQHTVLLPPSLVAPHPDRKRKNRWVEKVFRLRCSGPRLPIRSRNCALV